MHFERRRSRGVALAVAMVLVIVTGAGGGLVVADATGHPGDASAQVTQVDNETGDASDATETAATETETTSPTSTEPASEAQTATPDPEATERETTDSQVTSTTGSTEAAADDTATEAGNEDDATADGELSSCTEISEPGEYVLADDVDGSGTCIVVAASDVTVDGNGHTVAGDGSGTGIQVAGEVSGVTVRNVDVSDWGVGVQVGGAGAGGPTANLVEVRATASDTGVRLVEADGSAMQAVTASDNGAGVVLVDTANVQASDVTVDGNDGTGLWLARGVTDSSFSIVQATGNGDRGIHVATGAVDNFVGDATVTDNGGPGVEFSDSSNNVLADSSVERNDGPGVLSYPAGGDRLDGVEMRDNGDGAYRDRGERAGAVADAVRLRGGASVRFDQGVTRLAAAESPQSLPDDSDAAGPAIDVALRDGADASATVTVPVDASGDVTAYQRVNGAWMELTDATVRNGEMEVTVTRSGVVVPVTETSAEDAGVDDDATGGDGPTTDETNGESVGADTDADGEGTTTGPTGTDDDTAEPETVALETTGDGTANPGSGGAAEPETGGAAESETTDAGDRDTGTTDDVDGDGTDAAGTTSQGTSADSDAHVLVIGPDSAGETVDYTLHVEGEVTKVTDGNATAASTDDVSRTSGVTTIDATTSTTDTYVVEGQLRGVCGTVGGPGYFLQYGPDGNQSAGRP